MKTIFLLLYSIARLHGFGQAGSEPVLYTRLGVYDSTANSSNCYINPARLAVVKSVSASLYAEQRFLLAELLAGQMAAAIPASPGSFGISGSRFGGAEYNYAQLGLAYARSLGNRADLGLRFHYARQQAAGYRNAGFIYFELGSLIRINDQLQMGLHVVQPLPAFAKSKETGALSSYCVGFGYRPSAAVVVIAEMIRKEGQPASLHAAMRYRFERRLQASIGINTGTDSFYMGGGVGLGWLVVEAVSSFHPLLGLSPALMISFQKP